MIRHYLTFARQAASLDAALRGWTLAECWSQEKNTVVLRFIRGRDSVFAELAFDPQLGYGLMREEMHRARRNTIDFFQALIGVQLSSAGIDEHERVIRLHFVDGHTLACFFFGGGGGNVLLLRSGEVVSSFRRYDGDYDRILNDAPETEPPSMNDIVAALRASDDPPLRALMHAVPNLGRRLAAEALERAGLGDASMRLRLREEAELEHLLETVDTLWTACEASRTCTLYFTGSDVIFALIPLQTVASEAVRTETFNEIGDAVRTWRSAWHGVHAVAALRERITKRLAAEIVRMERSLANRMDAPAHVARAEEWELSGKLLMAHLHDVPKGEERVRLVGWDGEEHEVAMNPKLSPVENAERYFRRARGARDAAARSVAGIEKNRAALERVRALAGKAAAAATNAELERIEATNRDLFTMTAETKAPGSAERFRRFEVAGGVEVYAGKNAANNDELTVRFARPNDYWLHARGTSGSHVVLRWNDTKTKPSKDALRAAASIAAYYSGARGAKMVPVAYTLKKHVRKPRGAAPGAVVMDREEVIMAEPKLPQGSAEE
ncbi:MAG TPA: NFACT RNA binding domain-containing protein [Candidatus Kapabacteria bacterium]|nr:NFACT RNA binding domain-containing protein [Candidatus Kapabacteria bacterium]